MFHMSPRERGRTRSVLQPPGRARCCCTSVPQLLLPPRILLRAAPSARAGSTERGCPCSSLRLKPGQDPGKPGEKGAFAPLCSSAQAKKGQSCTNELQIAVQSPWPCWLTLVQWDLCSLKRSLTGWPCCRGPPGINDQLLSLALLIGFHSLQRLSQ